MEKIISYINKSSFRIKVFLFLSGLFIASCLIVMNIFPRTIEISYMKMRLDTLTAYLKILNYHLPLPVFKIDESYHMPEFKNEVQ